MLRRVRVADHHGDIFHFNPLLEALVVAALMSDVQFCESEDDFNPLLEALVVAATKMVSCFTWGSDISILYSRL